MTHQCLRRLADFLEFKCISGFPACENAVSITLVKVEKNMKINFSVGGKLTELISAVFADAAGNPTSAHGTVSFASSDETIATVAAEPDGISALVTGTGKIGTCTITGTDEKDNASDMATVTTVSGEATSMTLVDADPTDTTTTAATAATTETETATAQTSEQVGGDGPTH